MKIGIISDLHGIFPQIIKNFIADTDEIWCLGDIWTEDVLNEVKALGKPVVAVYGNWEEEKNSPLLNILPKKEVIQREGLTILLTHKDWGYNQHYEGIDLHCYGHKHEFEYKTSRPKKGGNRTFCLNPGAVTPLFHGTSSAVTIEIDNGHIHDCRRLVVQCDYISMQHNEDKYTFGIIYDKKPKRFWIFSVFGTPWPMTVENNESETYAYNRKLIADNLVSGNATDGYIIHFADKDGFIGGAFMSVNEQEDIITVEGIGIKNKDAITADDITSIVSGWYCPSELIIK